MHQQYSKRVRNKESEASAGFLIQPPARVRPPSQPICLQNPSFRLTMDQIFHVLFMHLSPQRIFVSGGCLSRTYIDPEMSDGHKQSFGDIDFKLPLCTPKEMQYLLKYLNIYQALEGDLAQGADEKRDFSLRVFIEQLPYIYRPFILAFHELFNAGGVLKKFYFKEQKKVADYKMITRSRVVVNMDWYGVTVDFVVFEESVEDHALGLDLSISAGFYNPLMENIYFPCDDIQEPYAYHLMAPCDRSAKDFRSKELNLLFPKEYVSLFENDPIRILRIIQALSRSDFTLSKVLEYDIKKYIKTHKNNVFNNINPDRFYHNLKSLFCSGHAVKNLKKLLHFELFEELFPYVRMLSTESKALTLYLVNCAVIDCDHDFLLSPSLLFYAVYWNDIKQKSYSPYSISDLSCGMVNIPVASFSKTKKSNERDVLNETIHRENIAYLSLCEKKYQVQFESERTLEGNLIILEKKLIRMMVDEVDKSWDKPSFLFLKSRQNALATIAEENEDICLLEMDANASKSVIGHQCAANDYATHCQRAIISLNIEKYKEAKANFKRAITLNPSLPDAYCGLAQVAKIQADNYNASIQSALSQLNLLKSSSKTSQKSITKCTTEHQVYAKQQNDQYLQAVVYCEQALARSAHYPPATQLLRTIGDAVKHPVEAIHATSEEAGNLFPFALPIERLKTPMAAAKCSSLKSIEDKTTSIVEHPTMNTDGHPLNDKHEQMIEDAIQEEAFEHYQKAIDIYNKLSVGNHTLRARHRCIRLYVKLNQYDKALKYVNRLVDISEEDYNHRYGRHETRQVAPFDNYQYHHYAAILLRGETYLKLEQLGEAIKNFECIIQGYLHSPDDFDNARAKITMRSYLYKGKATHQLARAESERILMKDSREQTQMMKMNIVGIQQEHNKKLEVAMLEVMERDTHAQQDYESAKILINKLGPDFNDYLILVYFGLGEIEQLKGHMDGSQSAKEYYEIGLRLIHEKIHKNEYGNDLSIHNELFRSAEHISGMFISNTNERLLCRKQLVVFELDLFFMEFSKKIYLQSLLYVPKNEFKMANIQLIKISLILNQYDDAILQIETILSGNLKGSSCCRRELFLLLGECYERKAMHRIAIQYYKKVQVLRYDDDNSQRQALLNLAQNAMDRILMANQFLAEPIGCSDKKVLASIASRSVLHMEEATPLAIQQNIEPIEPMVTCVNSLDEKYAILESKLAALGRDVKADEIWFQIGRGEHASGEYHHAIDSYTRAIELNPYHLQCYFSRIESSICVREYDSALRDTAFLLGIDENDYNQHYKVSQKTPYDQYQYHLLSARCQQGYVHLVKAQQRIALDDTQALLDFDYTIKECAKFKTQDFRTLASYALNGRGLCYETRAQALRGRLHELEKVASDVKRVINDMEAEAISAYQQVIARSPSSDKRAIEKESLSEAYRGLGNIAKAKGELATFNGGLNKKEFNAGIRYLDRAEQYYFMAIRMNPNMSTSLLGLGYIEDMRSQFDSMEPEDIRKHQDAARIYYLNSLQERPNCHEAHLRLGWIARIQGDANEASSRYKQYFLLIRAELEMNAGTISPEDMCINYCQVADKIVSGEKILSKIKQLFFSIDQLPMLNDFDLNFFSLLQCIYSKAVGYSSRINNAQIKLISILIILGHYDDAIERIQQLLQAKFTTLEWSKRELYYLCAKMHEMKNNHVEVKKHYLQAVRSKPYDDDNESSLHIISHAKMSLKKIIALDVERARTSGIAHLNMFAEQATVSLMGNVQLPSEEQEHRLTSRL